MDYLKDRSLQVFDRIVKQYGVTLPEYVKQSDFQNDTPTQNLPISAFGNPVDGTFPCHSKAATYLAALYLLGQENAKTSFPAANIMERIEKSAKFWGIEEDVKQLQQTIKTASTFEERDLNDEDYALVQSYGGEIVRRFPVVSRASIKKSAADLYENKTHYPYAWRKRAANKILQRAYMLDMLPHEFESAHINYLVKAAGRFKNAPETAAYELAKHAHFHNESIRKSLVKAACVVAKNADNVDKLCEIVDNADRDFAKWSDYNTGMSMPEDIFYTGIPDVTSKAAELRTVKLTTGAEFALDEIKKAGVEPLTVLGPEYLSDLVTNDNTVDIEKAAELLPTMPRDEAKTVEAALRAVGIFPVNTKSSALSSEREKWLKACRGEVTDEDFRISVQLRHAQDTH